MLTAVGEEREGVAIPEDALSACRDQHLLTTRPARELDTPRLLRHPRQRRRRRARVKGEERMLAREAQVVWQLRPSTAEAKEWLVSVDNDRAER